MIGVLALQGGFRAHIEKCEAIGVSVREIRYPQDLQNCSGLIIPGGESTTISSLLNESFERAICSFARQKPIFGTCAGLIILARLGLIDIEVERNAYGRQVDSFLAQLEVVLDAQKNKVPALFIRAPKIIKILKPEVEILSCYQNEPVFVSQKNIFCATFHPELTDSNLVHAFFLRRCHEQSTW